MLFDYCMGDIVYVSKEAVEELGEPFLPPEFTEYSETKKALVIRDRRYSLDMNEEIYWFKDLPIAIERSLLTKEV